MAVLCGRIECKKSVPCVTIVHVRNKKDFHYCDDCINMGIRKGKIMLKNGEFWYGKRWNI